VVTEKKCFLDFTSAAFKHGKATFQLIFLHDFHRVVNEPRF